MWLNKLLSYTPDIFIGLFLLYRGDINFFVIFLLIEFLSFNLLRLFHYNRKLTRVTHYDDSVKLLAIMEKLHISDKELEHAETIIREYDRAATKDFDKERQEVLYGRI